jgi:hypothetical protein
MVIAKLVQKRRMGEQKINYKIVCEAEFSAKKVWAT